MEYLVEWTIEVYADSPEDAAEEALKVQRDLEAMATFFRVTDEVGNVFDVDLHGDEGERVVKQ